MWLQWQEAGRANEWLSARILPVKGRSRDLTLGSALSYVSRESKRNSA
jgi:hypothetical protein